MGVRVSGLWRRVAGFVALGWALVTLVAGSLSVYGIWHNAFYTCDAEPRPAGARPYEAGYAGHDITLFPVVGTECTWNAVGGGVFTTLIAAPGATALLLAAVVFSIAAVVLLGVRRSRTRPRTMQPPSAIRARE